MLKSGARILNNKIKIKSKTTVFGSPLSAEALTSVRHSSVSNKDYQFLDNSSLPTYHFQASLPQLPVPELPNTCRRYLASLKPLLSDEQYAKTNAFVSKFQQEEGKGLQEELVALNKQNKHTSYVTEPWFDMYLKCRDSIVLNFNPFMMLVNDSRPEYNDQLLRATNMLVSSLRFMKSLRAENLAPEVFHLNPEKSDTPLFRNFTRVLPSRISWYGAYLFNAYPLDMSQYSSLFNSTRIPAKQKDLLFKDESARHILVIKNGQFYVFDVVDANGNIYEPQYLLKCMSYIVNDKRPPPEHSVSYLTSEERDTWASARQELINNGNSEVFKKIDSAFFALILDDVDIGEDYKIASTNMLYGNGANRWFDKSFQIIINKDGKAALNFEHSWGDGVAVMRFFNEILEDSTKNPRLHPDSKPADVDPSSLVTCLEFKLSDASKQFIKAAKEKFTKTTSSLDLVANECTRFGKKFLKQENVSPDAVMQLAFQMAFYRQYGKTVATYESCSTAAFKHGRTETIRPATIETKLCSEAFNKKQRPSNEELRALIENCSKKHGTLTKRAAMGQGFDRHLFIMRILAEANGMKPTIFSDPSYQLINHNIISTSTLPSPYVMIGGFGPVVQDGFGVGYVIRNDMAGTVITSYPPHRDGKGYTECIAKSLDDIADVLEKTSKSKKAN